MLKSYFRKFRSINFGIAISMILVLSCAYSFANAPRVMCMLYTCHSSSSTIVITMFPRSVAVACMVSRMTVIYKNVGEISEYRKKLEEYELYFPTDVRAENLRRRLTAAVLSFCAVLILPINAYRIYLFYSLSRNTTIVLFYSLMYVQNVSMYMTEMRFIAYCFGLYQKFQSINEELSALKSETIVANQYPSVLKSKDRDDGVRVGPTSDLDRSVSEIGVRPSADGIELLKMRHRFVSDAVRTLNRLYEIQLGLSLCILFVMTLIDIYQVVSNILDTAKPSLLFYGWMFQYMFRFCTIVLTTNVTTIQAHKSKKLITDINNRNLNSNTKGELQLFLNEISSRSVEFTTFDFFTLNTSLITSVLDLFVQYGTFEEGNEVICVHMASYMLLGMLWLVLASSKEMQSAIICFIVNGTLHEVHQVASGVKRAIVAGTTYLIILLQFAF